MPFEQYLQSDSVWVSVTICATITVVGFVVLRTLIGVIAGRLRRWSGHATSHFYRIAVEMLSRTSNLLLLAFALLIGLKVVDLPPRWEDALRHGWFIVLALQVAMWLDGGVRLWMSSLLDDPAKVRNPVTTTIIGIMIRIVIWTMMLLSILANLGVDITALVASLGVGGIAVALAVQTLLSDVFASLSIGVDKPFELGDFVIFGDELGTIEHIGLKTTRIRALSGEQIVCSNARLLDQTIHNYKRMAERRVVFTFGVVYDTPPQKLRAIGALVKAIISSIEQTRFDRAHFVSFDDYRLKFEVVYYVLSPDYNVYMDIQQEINLRIMERLREIEVAFALPMRHVWMRGELATTTREAVDDQPPTLHVPFRNELPDDDNGGKG
ncbi:MAG: mechanosensitive ion channel family protein [Spongiibacteraceae bacterium]|jgi:small-conductance mechanosensitive channel|nr:mechanosensitive ion channel family protein [Spongiibacteraceae bacterium]